ncbi:MAG TPA: Na+/H+ antiporter NhaA [Bacteroidota bacterium]|nr:Na+/H+ antiporter NhaA [Bacteroidota bacterium]
MLSRLFSEFFRSERAGGILLFACTLLSLAIANSPAGTAYVQFWGRRASLPGADLTVAGWIDQGLMAVFFLLVTLEIRREFSSGELSDLRRGLLPAVAATGGMIAPACLYLAVNAGTPAAAGFGIPMATDIAFSLGALSLLGARVPPALKVFLAALAIIDDLGAIIVIALFYTGNISAAYIAGALTLFAALLIIGHKRDPGLSFYILPGIAIWYCLMRSGIHPTIAGVLMAFAIPQGSGDALSPASRLQHLLHIPVACGILPLFALASTAIPLGAGWENSIAGRPSIGIIAGIGFTMSIFVAHLAFSVNGDVNGAVMAILGSSALAGGAGLLYLRVFGTNANGSQ